MIIAQNKSYNCGAIAIYNSFQMDSNLSIPLEFLEVITNTTKHGVGFKDMKKALLLLVSGKLINNFTYIQGSKYNKNILFNKLVKTKPNTMILGYYVGNCGHYTAIFKKNKQFYATNTLPDKLLKSLSYKKHLQKMKIDLEWIKEKLSDKQSEIFFLY